MSFPKKPYLIIPKLIEQPTWGGNYITKFKSLTLDFLNNKKIGQSHELSGQTKILKNVTDPRDPNFCVEWEGKIIPPEKYFSIEEILGQSISILIKLTQAFGNSFQLHVKPENESERWKTKAESWYYLKDGLATLGMKENCDLQKYQSVCQKIAEAMKGLSHKVTTEQITLDEARQLSQHLIQEFNPWRFVNQVKIAKNSVVDLSTCGIHHSWEEDQINYPEGNIIYEVQQDVRDDVSSIRSFDKGKFKDDGSLRPIAIDSYFQNLDLSPEKNTPEKLISLKTNGNLVINNNYRLDLLEIKSPQTYNVSSLFEHLFVKEGEVEVVAEDGKITLPAGYSCLLPKESGKYQIISKTNTATLLKTYV